MATESKIKSGKTEKKEPTPGGRRSGRLAGTAPSAEEAKVGDKRTASDSTSAPTKKPKVASKTSSKAIKSKSKTDTTSKSKSKTSKAEAEAEAEAPADAEPEEPDTDESDGKVIKVGKKLPKIVLKDEEGEDVEVGKLAGERGVVIFLYPKANTPGCTNQACGFRDAFDEISELGYDIYGLSRDGPTAQKNWKSKQRLNYSLLCDPDSVLIKRLGSFVLPKNTKRSHFIFEKGTGKLIEAKYGVKPADDPGNCLKSIKAHHA